MKVKALCKVYANGRVYEEGEVFEFRGKVKENSKSLKVVGDSNPAPAPAVEAAVEAPAVEAKRLGRPSRSE